MTKLMLSSIKSAMDEMGINYEFGVYTAYPIQYPYLVGEYIQTLPMYEDGQQDCTFHLNGFTRDSWDTLEDVKTLVSKYFPKVGGKCYTDDEGNTVCVYYGNSRIIPTGDAELKRIQIDLIIKEWTVI